MFLDNKLNFDLMKAIENAYVELSEISFNDKYIVNDQNLAQALLNL